MTASLTLRTRSSRALPLVVAAALGTVLVAIGVGLAPVPTILLMLGLMTAVALFQLPRWLLPAIVVAAAALSALLRLELLDGGTASVGLLGQGRVVFALAVVAAWRATLDRASLGIPRGFVLVVAIFAAAMLVSAFVGVINGTASPTLWPDVQRHLSWIIGGVLIGLLAADRDRDLESTMRALAMVVTIAALLSILYWAWVSGRIRHAGVRGPAVRRCTGRSGLHSRGDPVAIPVCRSTPEFRGSDLRQPRGGHPPDADALGVLERSLARPGDDAVGNGRGAHNTIAYESGRARGSRYRLDRPDAGDFASCPSRDTGSRCGHRHRGCLDHRPVPGGPILRGRRTVVAPGLMGRRACRYRLIADPRAGLRIQLGAAVRGRSICALGVPRADRR